jgi:hypothetical protein
MRRVRRFAAPFVLVAAVAAAVVQAPLAQAQSTFTIRTSQGAVARIGAFHPSRSPTLAAAIRVFGRPSSRRLTTDNSCQVDWRRLRLRIMFANFGGHRPGQTTCTPSVGRAQAFTVARASARPPGCASVAARPPSSDFIRKPSSGRAAGGS